MTHDPSRQGPGISTLAIHAGDDPSQVVAPRATPILGAAETSTVMEERLAILEGGIAAVAAVSGLAAHLTVLHLLLSAGDEVLVSRSVFGRDLGRLTEAADEFGWTVTAFDPTDPDGLADAASPRLKAIVVESLLATGHPVDLEALAAIAQQAEIPLVVDNTLATPALIRPITHGANIVVHAGAMSLTGQDTATFGLVVDGGNFDWSVGGKLARPRIFLDGQSIGDRFGNFAFAAALRTTSLRDLGSGLAAAETAAALAGLATLELRVRRQGETALAITRHLSAHPAVERTAYAGLEDGTAAGPILSFVLHGGADHASFAHRLQLVAVSGPAGRARSALADAAPSKDRLICLYVGLEDVDDLIADLDQALAGAMT